MSDFRASNDVVVDYVKIRKIDGGELDITNIIGGIDIFENLYAAGITAHFHVYDGVNFYDNFPIHGGELIDVRFRNDFDGSNDFEPNEVNEHTFYVNNISELTEGSNDRSHVYTIECVSSILIENTKTKLSRYVTGYNHDIVRHICENVLNIDSSKLTIENTKYVSEFIIPQWSPIQTLNYLSRKSISDATNDPGYLFYEDKYGFNFVSMTTLFNNDLVKRISQEYLNTEALSTNKDIFLKYTVESTSDVNEMSLNGAYGGNLTIIDLQNKSFSNRVYDHSNNSYAHLNTTNYFQPDDSTSMYHDYTYGDGTNSTNFKLQRLARINELNHFTMMIKMPGDSRLTVGQKLYVDIPNHFNLDEGITQNKFLSGNYIIRGLRHIISELG